MEARHRIIVALDTPNMSALQDSVVTLADRVGPFKVGLEALTALGSPTVVKAVHDGGGTVMYDGKFHDIPHTMGGAAAAVASLKVKMFTIHGSSGPRGIAAAVKNRGDSLVIGVTVLTSHDTEECISIFGDNPQAKVRQFTRWLIEQGAQCVVCSPEEAAMIRQEVDPDRKLIVITPGVRPEWYPAGDQKRVMTPGEAIKAGADYLVIGRPILKPPPEVGRMFAAAQLIAAEIASAV